MWHSRQSKCLKQLVWGWLFVSVWIGVGVGIAQARIFPLPIAQTSRRPVRWQPPPPPPNLGEPQGRGQGGGSRGDCQDYRYITPLVPKTVAGYYWGRTLNQRPNLWVYTPRGFSANLPIEIRLVDQQGTTIAKQRLRAQATPAGVVALPLPELPPTKTYWWELAVYCNAEFPDVPVIRRGLIQRILPTASMDDRLTQTIDPIAKATWNAEQGLWYDALDAIGTATHLTPTSQSNVWADLLQQADLSGFITAPIRRATPRVLTTGLRPSQAPSDRPPPGQ